MKLYTYFKEISKYLMLLSKIIMILLSFYYLFNYQKYNITLNVPLVLRSYSIIDLPLKLLESFNMSIIIFPLTIILLSFYHPDNNKLKILAGFCAIGGNLFSIAHLASKGLLEESFKTFFLTVYNVPSLDIKIKLFSEFFNQRINIYCVKVDNIVAFKSFIQTQINNNFDAYTNMLKTLPQLDIMSYATRIADQLYENYTQNLIPSNTASTVSTTSYKNKIIKGLLYGIAGVAIIFFSYKTYQNAVLLKEAGAEIWDLGRRFTRAVRGIKQTDSIVTTVNKDLTDLGNEVITVGKRISTVEASTALANGIIATNADTLKSLIDRVKNIELNLNNLCIDSVADPKPNGNGLSILIDNLRNQMQSLAKGGLNTNNTVKTLTETVAKIENKMNDILTQQAPLITNVASTEKAQVAAQAADMRWIEESRNKIREFDVLTKMKEIKTLISQQTKLIADDLSQKIETQITAAKQNILDKKNVIKNQVENVSKEINDIKKALNDKVDSDNLQATVIRNTDNKIRTLEQADNNLTQNIEQVRTDLQQFKDEFQTFRTATNTHLMELQKDFSTIDASLKSFVKDTKKMFADYQQYVASSLRLVQNVNTDNASISVGSFTPRPFISTNPSILNSTARNNLLNRNNN